MMEPITNFAQPPRGILKKRIIKNQQDENPNTNMNENPNVNYQNNHQNIQSSQVMRNSAANSNFINSKQQPMNPNISIKNPNFSNLGEHHPPSYNISQPGQSQIPY